MNDFNTTGHAFIIFDFYIVDKEWVIHHSDKSENAVYPL